MHKGEKPEFVERFQTKVGEGEPQQLTTITPGKASTSQTAKHHFNAATTGYSLSQHGID